MKIVIKTERKHHEKSSRGSRLSKREATNEARSYWVSTKAVCIKLPYPHIIYILHMSSTNFQISSKAIGRTVNQNNCGNKNKQFIPLDRIT